MQAISHGRPLDVARVLEARDELASVAATLPGGFTALRELGFQRYDFLFAGLQDDPANLLPTGPATLDALKALSATMVDQDTPGADSAVPAAYTYYGQFVDHDVTLEATTGSVDLFDPNLTPLSVNDIRDLLQNTRSAVLDLDSVYGGRAARDGDHMLLGTVAPIGGRPPGKTADNDLPRDPRNADPALDRAARIGDPRNDENLVVAQLHLAFLKAHNRLVDEGGSFDQAQRTLRQHHQHLVLRDYLPKIADPAIVDSVITDGNRFYNALAEPFFLPLEFTVAAYRFGHTLVRANYDYNLNFPNASLDLLFTFTALSGQLGGFDTLPENWIIQWERFIGPGQINHTRLFDTQLATANAALFALRGPGGGLEQGLAAHLSARNLLRGYLLRMPTGQAVAGVLGLTPLTAAELLAAVPPDQAQALQAGDMAERTPLWFYLLAEAAHGGGDRLGPVGSTLVAEVLVGLVRRSPDSILSVPGWQPSLPSADRVFGLADLLRFARVLDGGTPTRTYTVQPGDTLSGIAASELGDGDRWPEIFALNGSVLTNPDVIVEGQVLQLPPM